MSASADLILTNAAVHCLDDERTEATAVAIADNRIIRVGSTRHVERLAGVETVTIDCDGLPVLPGFVDAHTHLETTGRYLVHADLSHATSRDAALDRLSNEAADGDAWALGFGYDESNWEDSTLLTRDDLDAVSTRTPIAAFRVDMHTASLNTPAFEQLTDRFDDEHIEMAGGEPTGVVLEDAVDVVRDAGTGGLAYTERLLEAAERHAIEAGVTCVHELVRHSDAPRIYREQALRGELPLRVRINYWHDHLASIEELGLRTNFGTERLQIGAIKSFTDGAIGGRTAKLTAPYTDGDGTGQWVVTPEELQETVSAVDEAESQMAIHAIGDAAIESALSALETTGDPAQARHRIEHVELASDDHIERMAEAGIVASMQPNFLQWAGEGGLYEHRLGPERTAESNRFRDLLDAGVPLAFGSDSMPLDPLFGIQAVVNAPEAAQRLTVTEAIEAYTRGGAYAGFDEDRLGTIEPGTLADLVMLDGSPWESDDRIDDLDVVTTIVGGEVVYEDRT